MKIQSSTNYQSTYLKTIFDSNLNENTKNSSMNKTQKQPVTCSISEEGQSALRAKLKQLGIEQVEEIDLSNIQPIKTNEVAWEHYSTMMDMSGLTLKDGNYNLEDVTKSIMETYEACYNQIIKDHESGDRQVSYELSGERSISLEEDLAGLDEAYKWRLSNLQGYITAQQTNKTFEHPEGGTDWFFKHSQVQLDENNDTGNDNYFDPEYSKTAISMMEQARQDFLSLFKTENYKPGMAKGIITDIMHSNTDFIAKTKKLFKKYN